MRQPQWDLTGPGVTVLVNELSLTRPAVVKRVFHLFLYLNESFSSMPAHPCACAGAPCCSTDQSPSSISDPRPPYSLSPCHFITAVLPTKHLFDPSGP